MAKSDRNKRIKLFPLLWQVMLEEYEHALKTDGKSQKTIEGYLQNTKKYFTFLDANDLMRPIEKLGKKELREYISYLQNRARWLNNPHIREENRGQLSSFAVRAYVKDIKTLWSWMHKEGYIEENPLVNYPLPAVPENLVKTITPSQFATLISKVDTSTPEGLKYYCIMLILYDNGMRVSELVMIKIANIDFQNKYIKIIGKGRKERLVPITVFTRRHIIRYLDRVSSKIYPNDSPYLFVNSYGEPISKNSVQQFMRRLLAKSGLKGVKFSPHILRHSFATQYLANGGNVFYLKAVLGHASLTTTLKYTQVQVKDLQDQHAKFSPVAKLFNNKS